MRHHWQYPLFLFVLGWLRCSCIFRPEDFIELRHTTSHFGTVCVNKHCTMPGLAYYGLSDALRLRLLQTPKDIK
ncbi:hypothetical protein B0J11DRAFT_250352 [Dendryphion nanum]|uniref:Secreted protein n=1 Tax=Dendryphion nanum TaxID=256645 RepID=A0A9P9IRC6_9PLEO|nr:hypothetical protein B0J11DRAFT_250352 [Dendryphion nanum]